MKSAATCQQRHQSSASEPQQIATFDLTPLLPLPFATQQLIQDYTVLVSIHNIYISFPVYFSFTAVIIIYYSTFLWSSSNELLLFRLKIDIFMTGKI